jgi:hypothetical protein
VASAKISEDDCRRILSLFEMTQRAFQEDVDEHTQNEAANVTAKLLRLLAKYGLDLGDIPEIRRHHEQSEAAKAARTASPATASNNRNQPNALELTHHVLQNYVDIAPHEQVGASLWFLHTHVFGRFQISPRLALLSPVRSCGKSKVLFLAERLVANPERHDNITAPQSFG